MRNMTTAALILLLAVAVVAQDDRTIDRYETKFLELITEYKTHERIINDPARFYVPLLGSEPEPMGEQELTSYLLELKLYRGVNVSTIAREALQFSNAYKEQMRFEYMPMVLNEFSRELNNFTNYLTNRNAPLSDEEFQLLLRMNMVLDDFSRIDSVKNDPFISSALGRTLRTLNNLGGGGGGVQPNVDTRYIDKIEGNWELSRENKPTMVIKIYLDGQKGSYCGRILTQPNVPHYNQGDVIWRDIHFVRVYDDDWEVERYKVYEFEGIEWHYISGEWREDPLYLTLYCETWDSDGDPEGCASLGWNSVTRGFSLKRPLN